MQEELDSLKNQLADITHQAENCGMVNQYQRQTLYDLLTLIDDRLKTMSSRWMEYESHGFKSLDKKTLSEMAAHTEH